MESSATIIPPHGFEPGLGPALGSSISVIIPVHNESLSIRAVLDDVVRVLGNRARVEVLVVDDGSTDDSAAIVAAHADPRIRLIRTTRRQGSGAAKRIGIHEATGDLILWIDGDGSYAPEDLRQLIDATAHADQVVGARSTDHGDLAWLRRAVKSSICSLVSRLWRTPIPDVNSGMRAFRRSALLAILPQLPHGFSCCTTATLASFNLEQRVVFVPIGYHTRTKGSVSKFHPIADTWRLLLVIWRQWRTRQRVNGAAG